MSADPLRDFILRDAENLRVAAAVGEAWPSARGHIATTFLGRLEDRLLRELPGWTAWTWETFFAHSYPSFGVTKGTWAEQYSVALQADQFGGNMLFGVQRDNNKPVVAARPLSPEVLASVRSAYPSARSKKWWDAQVPMRSPATDWRPPAILWRMYSDITFVNGVAEQMIAVARAAEPILDGLAV